MAQNQTAPVSFISIANLRSVVKVKFLVGYIKAALSLYNHYEVATAEGSYLAIAQDVAGGRQFGVRGSHSYLPGTYVLIAVQETSGTTPGAVQVPTVILAAFPVYPLPSGTDFSLQPAIGKVGFNANELMALLINPSCPVFSQNRSFNKPLDVLAGDLLYFTALGGMLLLSDFLAQFGVSANCNWRFNGLNDSAELVATRINLDSGGIVQRWLQRGNEPLAENLWALTIAEGLGAGSKGAFAAGEVYEGQLKPTQDAAQKGFFRRMLLQGGAVEGSWDTIRTLTSIPENYKYTDIATAGLFSEVRRMDGIYCLQAAKEIRFERTCNIRVPEEQADIEKAERTTTINPDPDFDDLEYKRQQLGLATIEEVSSLLPLLKDRFKTIDELTFFFRGLRKDNQIWVFSEHPEQLVDVAPVRLPLLKDAPEYTVDDLIGMAVAVYPGRKVRFFKNSSSFLMADDGGVIIGDGYGAEIRMTKGNILITAAADVKIIAGRDMVEMIPGNRNSRVGNRIEFSSTKGSVALKAQENMQLVSGNEITGGALTIENKSSADKNSVNNVKTNAIEKGTSLGSGIVLKGAGAGISLLGKYVYAGGYTTGEGESTDGLDAAATSCQILLDSGAGSLMLTGKTGMLSFTEHMGLGITSTIVGLYLDNTRMVQMAPTHFLCSPVITIDKGSNVFTSLKVTKSGISSQKVSMPTTAPQLSVFGNMKVKSDVEIEGDVIVAKGVKANDGCNEDPLAGSSRRAIKMTQSSPEQILLPITKTWEAVNTLQQTLVEQYGVQTEWGHKITDFAFPNSDSSGYRAAKFKLVLPVWHTLLQNGIPWEEKGIRSSILREDTYPYPGRQMFAADKKPLIDTGTTKAYMEKTMAEFRTNTGV